MHHTATATLSATLLALTGCSASTSGNSKPTKPTPAATSSASAKASHTDQVAACTDAMVARKDKGPGAPECTELSPDDYLKALQAANQRGQDAIQQQIDGASASAVAR
ncbi:hypothetical protein [Streptomyces sp. TP-A0356]|uniref:hypothetical protein n=1 Tax=Streptomyces sp. TP-A0356 TaxID=1359208 RepID=UPI0006E157B1|nr:hypothetical protein [Streptomyces sp. TP-A0356]